MIEKSSPDPLDPNQSLKLKSFRFPQYGQLRSTYRQLLRSHKAFLGQGSVAENLGDGYLLRNNRIYRSIRRQTIKNGYRFCSSSMADYSLFPLLTLPNIHQEKVIPFHRTHQALQTLAPLPTATFKSIPHFAKLTNYLFHESCHAVAREVLQADHNLILKGRPNERRETAVLKILMEESFANTCETFGMVDVNNRIHQDFFNFNSYIRFSSVCRLKLLEGLEFFGPKGTFQILFYGYVFSNFLFHRLGKSELKILANLALNHEFSQLTKQQIRRLKSLLEISLGLNPDFRVKTNLLYFQMQGWPSTLDRLLDFNFPQKLQEEAFKTDASRLSQVALKFFGKTQVGAVR